MSPAQSAGLHHKTLSYPRRTPPPRLFPENRPGPTVTARIKLIIPNLWLRISRKNFLFSNACLPHCCAGHSTDNNEPLRHKDSERSCHASLRGYHNSNALNLIMLPRFPTIRTFPTINLIYYSGPFPCCVLTTFRTILLFFIAIVQISFAHKNWAEYKYKDYDYNDNDI